jgi:predicted CoA-binding protein
MKTRKDIEIFLNANSFALCGLSRSGKKFSNMLFNRMIELNYTVYPVNPNAEIIGNHSVFDSLSNLPKDCKRVILMTPKNEGIKLIKEAIAIGIHDIWVQQGAENQDIIDFSNKHPEYNIVYGYCLWMFVSPNGFPHNLHKGILQILNKYPK